MFNSAISFNDGTFHNLHYSFLPTTLHTNKGFHATIYKNSIPLIPVSNAGIPVYELLRGTLGLRRKLAVSVKNRTELATRESESVHGTRNERVESVTTCWGSVSECGMGIGVGFFTETASFLRNPRFPRNSSYAGSRIMYSVTQL